MTNVECCSNFCTRKGSAKVCACPTTTIACNGRCVPTCTTDPCKKSACDTNTGQCKVVPKTNGVACDDGNPCTVGDTCQNGVCQPGGPKDCNDNDVCTTDTCDPTTGQCVHTAITGCCRNDSECNDSNVCTNDTCDQTTHTCVNVPITGCCQNDAQCATNNPCSTDTCDQTTHTCVHTPIANCCRNDADCNDNDPCTTDTCNQTTHTCVHTIVCNATCNQCNVSAPCNVLLQCGETSEGVCNCWVRADRGGCFCGPLVDLSELAGCGPGDSCPAGFTCVEHCAGKFCYPPCGVNVQGSMTFNAAATGTTPYGIL